MRKEALIIVGSILLTSFLFGAAGGASVLLVSFGFLVFGD